MPRTVDEGFRDFLTRLTPTLTESQAAKDHRASIESCLKTNFNITRFFRTGSFGNGTSISGYSDVDYFASIPSDKISQNSLNTLTRVRDAMDYRFPRTGVRVDCPAVAVPFGRDVGESTEIVPASLNSVVKFSNEDCIVYDISDCNGGWIKSSPDLHMLYVRITDQKLNNKVKPLIRFVKAWKYYQNVPISSFYLELRVTKFVENMSLIFYEIDLKSIFEHLYDVGLASMQDPKGVSGYISACNTAIQLEDAKSKLLTAMT